MPDVPAPITSPPAEKGQPYSADDPAPAQGSQSDQTHVYDADGGSGSSDPWPKVQAGGAADWHTGRVHDQWPTDGASDGSKWAQT